MLSKLYLYIVHSIFLLFYKKEYKKYMNSKNILAIQENKLKEILENNKGTLYGKKYNFDKIKTIQDFQKEVPLSKYEDYLPYIEKIKMGEEHILTYEKVKIFELTSGSTSASKLIPYTDSLKKEFQSGIKVWLYSLYKKYPSLKFGKSYWSITPKVDFQHKENSVIPIGFEEDSEYFGRFEKYLVDSIFVNPKDIKNEKDMDKFYFKTLLALVSEKNIRLFSFWSPSLLLLLIEYLEKNSEKILKTLNKKRREEVRKYIETKEYYKIWKNLRLISCWGDSNSTEYLKKIKEIFPNTVIQEKGLLATEGFISFPDTEENLSKLSIYSHFFEFLSLDNNRIYNASEIEINKRYELIITTSGGLYRYCIGDIIEVISIKNKVPYIKFIGRRGAVSDLFGERYADLCLGSGRYSAADHSVSLFAETYLFPFCCSAPRSGRDCFSDEQGTARTGSLDTGTACRARGAAFRASFAPHACGTGCGGTRASLSGGRASARSRTRGDGADGHLCEPRRA